MTTKNFVTINGDGSTVVKPGETAIIKPGETADIGGSSVTNTGDQIIIVDETGKVTIITPPNPGEDVIVNSDGTIDIPGGSVVAPEGSDQTTMPDAGGSIDISTGIVKLNTHTVKFETNGGTAIGDIVVNSGEKLVIPTTTTKDHWTFAAWYKDSGLTVPYDMNAAVTADMTLYAKWNRVEYTVTFNPNYSGASNTTQTTVNWKLASLTTPTRSYYKFLGWFNAASGGTQVTTNTEFLQNTTVYAHWEEIKYTITFNANGGSVTTATATTSVGKLTSLPTPTRTHYTFQGWYTAASGGTKITTSSTFNANTTIYAQWQIITYTVTASVSPTGYGTVTGAGTYNSGANVTVKATPGSGYKFVSWKNGSTVVSTNASYTFTASSNITLVATFQANNTGKTWTSTSVSGDWRNIAFGNGVFVTVGYKTNTAMWSTDGKTWTKTTLPATAWWSGIAFGNGKFIAIGGSNSSGDYIASSTDGKTWTLLSSGSTDMNPDGIIFANGKFYCAHGSYPSYVSSSTDGTTWTKSSSVPCSANGYLYDVAYAGGKFVAAGWQTIATSTNGTSWTQGTLPSGFSTGGNVCAINGRFFMTSVSTPTVTTCNFATSTNGTSWTTASTPSNTYWGIVAYGNGLYVVGGPAGIIYSTNGTSWTSATTAIQGISWMVYGNGRFVGVGNGITACSYDG